MREISIRATGIAGDWQWQVVERYVDSVQRWRWNVGRMTTHFLDDYVGHPMMGAITNSLWMQHDPKSMYLDEFKHLAILAQPHARYSVSTAYSFQWKLGPLGEASIGHNGDHFFPDQGARTNETGWVELSQLQMPDTCLSIAIPPKVQSCLQLEL